MVLVDTNVLLDLVEDDLRWAAWSIEQLDIASASHSLAINAVIYSELSMAFERIEQVEAVVNDAALKVETIPREALFLAGKVSLRYRRQRGTKKGVLPDFFIGAHAAVMQWPLLTRDIQRYKTYFPTVQLITPRPSS